MTAPKKLGRPRNPALGPKSEKLVVWRPSSEQVRQAYLALGGSKWLERVVREAANINQG